MVGKIIQRKTLLTNSKLSPWCSTTLPSMNFRRLLQPDRDLFNAARRTLAQFADQLTAPLLKRLKPPKTQGSFRAPTRFCLVTVNFSTTYYLKLMLLTLCEQERLSAINQMIIVDNNSRDGGIPFLEQLATISSRFHLLQNTRNCTHANGLRKGISHLERIEQSIDPKDCSNALLVCDTDIVFRNPQTVTDIASLLAKDDTVFAGELRHDVYPYPEAQASFFAVRRDCYARADIAPFVHHGAPAYFMQRSMWKAGLVLAHFPSNSDGYILHRGRSGVAAAGQYHFLNAHSTAKNSSPHFMGVKDGKKIWERIEGRYQKLLNQKNEHELLQYLREHLVPHLGV